MAAKITRAQLNAYIDDTLSDRETAQVEQALRESEPLRKTLRTILQERDRGEHSIGAIWRRQRLSCPTREQLGSYVLQVLEGDLQEYIDFHLKMIACPFCQANLTDLQSLQRESEPQTQQRRKRFFDSSAGYLSSSRETRPK
jgi:uncharacterized protein YbaR (Trm112 family)